MDADYFRLLFRYNAWANARVLGPLAGLTASDYATPNGQSPSIRASLAHALGVDVNTLARCQGISPSSIISEEDLPSVVSLVDRVHQHETEMEAFLSSLSDEDVNSIASYKTMRGQEFSQPVGHLLAHAINHWTQHRSDAAVALTGLGHSPGDLDLIVFLRNLS